MKRLPFFLILPLLSLVALAPLPAFAQAEGSPVTSVDPSHAEAAIQRAMEWLSGKEADPGNPQYSDYVVFCGQEVGKAYPQFQPTVEDYQNWVIAKTVFIEKLPYQSACHVMALDVAGAADKAKEMATQLMPRADNGRWLIPFHIGWYLYACAVVGDTALEDATFGHFEENILPNPDRHQYFTAYCLWKLYERSGNERYKAAFSQLVETLGKHSAYYTAAETADGHAGMMLSVFARAYSLSKDPRQLAVAEELATLLLRLQQEDGSWNGKTAYTVMPAEGLALYLKFCR